MSLCVITFISCNGGGDPPAPNNPCTGITVAVSGTTTNPTTGNSDGSITASATGGSGFTYSLNGGAFQSSGTFSSLAAGSYTITAKNGNGCTGSANFTLTAPNPCAGVTITVTGTTVNPATATGTTGSITSNATGGTAPYTYSKDGTNFQTSNAFNNLGAGNYTITAKDANGCTGVANFSLLSPCAGVTITVTGTTTNPTGPATTDGGINASASGGTGPYTYTLNTGAPQSSGIFNSLGAGNYSVTATAANGCTGSANFTLTGPNPCAGVTITIGFSNTSTVPCQSNNGSITANAAGGTGPYMFSLNNGLFQSTNIFSNLGAATYTVTVKDANNCQGSSNTTVGSAAAGPLFSQVKTLMLANCAIPGCHAGTQPPDWRVDCNIVNNALLIQQRAVFGNPSIMPPTGSLSAADKQKITDWVNAGGQYNN